MHQIGILLRDRQKLAELLRKCSKDLLYDEGKRVHGAVVKAGYIYDDMVNTYLIDMYGKCGRMDMARAVFDNMLDRSVVAWTALMCGYLRYDDVKTALLLFNRMMSSDSRPNEYTFSTNLKASGILGSVETGMQIHGLSCKSGFELYPVVGNSIIDMYARCGRIMEAEQMFRTMPVKSLITWNVMVTGYTLFEDKSDKALKLFKEMQGEGETPDEFTFTSMLKACRNLGAIRGGTQVHAFLISQGFPLSAHKMMAGALVDLYIQCGYLLEAQKMFNQIKTNTVISWMSLIMGYARQESLSEAMALFRQLRESNIPIDEYVLSSMISIFADFALLEIGKQMHSYAIKIPAGFELSVVNSILDMYIKCGLMEEAERLFGDMPVKNVVSYTVMITGYGKYGLGREAILLFKKMQLDFIEPDDVTYLAVLSACSHSGLLEESQECFTGLLNNKRIKLNVEHYACMVDVLGRAGQLEEAKNLINEMPLRPNVGIMQTLLSACRIYKNVEIASEVGEILLKMDGYNPVNYVMISNIFAETGFWEGRERIRKLMAAKGLKKETARSWVQIDKKIYFFYNGDKTHPLTESIHEMLKEMEKQMKEEIGYVAELNFSMHDVEDETKEETLRLHSERLAIGFALVCGRMEKLGQPIRIFKNLRVCGDCHKFIKGLSKILKKVFLVRDANRFHKFENGVCSCGDYW